MCGEVRAALCCALQVELLPRQCSVFRCADNLLICADLEQRVVASHLAGLWREHGADSWRNVTLDGAPVAMSASLGWHADKLPLRGTLILEFVSDVRVADTAVHISSERARGLLLGFTSDAVNDLWRLSYLRVFVSCFFVPGIQAAQVCLIPHLMCQVLQLCCFAQHYFCAKRACRLKRVLAGKLLHKAAWRVVQVLSAFTGPEEKLEAAAALFPRLTDPAQLSILLQAFVPQQRRRVHQRLGLLAFFDPANPTGRRVRIYLDCLTDAHVHVCSLKFELPCQLLHGKLCLA